MRYGRRSAKFLTTEGGAEGGAATFFLHQDHHGPGQRRPAGEAGATVLSSITTASQYPHLFALREELRSWSFLQLDPAALRSPSPKNAPETLVSDGSNLATVLRRISAETGTETRPAGSLAEINADLSAFVPGFMGLDVEPYDEGRAYRVRLRSAAAAFSSQVVSDGTLRILALLTLLHDPRHHGVVCFEEPENGIHPASLQTFLGMLRLMATPSDRAPGDPSGRLCQLLLNSHSPVVLSHLEPGEVVFADTVTSLDPAAQTRSRHTRMRPVRAQGPSGPDDAGETVRPFEVRQYLQSVKRQSA